MMLLLSVSRLNTSWDNMSLVTSCVTSLQPRSIAACTIIGPGSRPRRLWAAAQGGMLSASDLPRRRKMLRFAYRIKRGPGADASTQIHRGIWRRDSVVVVGGASTASEGAEGRDIAYW